MKLLQFDQLLRAEEIIIIRNMYSFNTGKQFTKYCPGLYFPEVNRILTFNIYCHQVHKKSPFKLRNIKKIIFKNLWFDFLIISKNFPMFFRKKTIFIKKSEFDEINENIIKQLFYNDELERLY